LTLIDAVVGDVSLNIIKIAKVKLFSANSQVSFFVYKNIQGLKRWHENPLADIKLSIVDQQGLLDVLLDDLRTHLFLVLIAAPGIPQ